MEPSPPAPPPSLDFLSAVTDAQRTLYAVLFSLLRDPHDVDDALQETNAVLWTKAAEYDPARPFLPWALKIAQLQALALRKRKGRRPILDDALVATLADEAAADADREEPRRRALAECLAKLPADRRRLALRRYEPGASVNALAAELGRSPKAVSEALRRTRAALLDCVERALAREARA